MTRSGAVLTKMDGDSRGGAALSMKAISGRPVKFISTGERLQQLEPFYPDRVASRILGMPLSCHHMLEARLWVILTTLSPPGLLLVW